MYPHVCLSRILILAEHRKWVGKRACAMKLDDWLRRGHKSTDYMGRQSYNRLSWFWTNSKFSQSSQPHIFEKKCYRGLYGVLKDGPWLIRFRRNVMGGTSYVWPRPQGQNTTHRGKRTDTDTEKHIPFALSALLDTYARRILAMCYGTVHAMDHPVARTVMCGFHATWRGKYGSNIDRTR